LENSVSRSTGNPNIWGPIKPVGSKAFSAIRAYAPFVNPIPPVQASSTLKVEGKHLPAQMSRNLIEPANLLING
jgi:hypothetical protein